MFWSGPDKSEAIMAADTSAQAAQGSGVFPT